MPAPTISSSWLRDKSIITESILVNFKNVQSMKLYFEYDCVNEMKTYEMCMWHMCHSLKVFSNGLFFCLC